MHKIYSYFYSNFVKSFYKQVCEMDNEEEVYYHKNKLVVLVKNEEISKRLYNVIKPLKDIDQAISTPNMRFKIDKYIIDNQGRVKLFCVNLRLVSKWTNFSKRQKLQELVAFAEEMQKKGYVLDDSIFESEKCNSISGFLSFFVLGHGKVESSKACIIKHIHYVLSDGGSLDEFYQENVHNNEIRSVNEFPYALPVITMCYNYFVTGSVPENIYDVLERELVERGLYGNYYYYNYNYLIASKSSLESNFKIIENNDEYTIYDGNIKIYHNVSPEFEKFLREDDERKINSRQEAIDRIDAIIIDFKGSIIGYKFFAEEAQSTYAILDKKFEYQCDIVHFMSDIIQYISNVKSQYHRPCTEVVYEIGDFNIEKSLIGIVDTHCSFKTANIKELFNLIISDENCLKEQITTIFFKIFLVYLNKQYGEIHVEEQFLDKVEVRCLSPVLAKEFINYALKQQTDIKVATKELYEFLCNTKRRGNNEIYYDSRFAYDPTETPFSFDYEVEKMYEIKIKNGISKVLPDGRRLVTFRRSKKVSNVKNKEKSLRDEIWYKIGDIEDKNVKIVGISELIYSKKINDDNMYNLKGYITEPIKGKQLTDEVLLNLNNKDLLKVAGYLFYKFAEYYIPWNIIWMDNDFIFYINILDDNFQIRECKESCSNISFMKWIICYLVEKGYNSNAFFNLDFSSRKGLLRLAYSFDAYCDEHGIYYNSADTMCPVCNGTKYIIPKNFERESSKIIFEDFYAKHYRIDSDYNLKVYKTSFVDMAGVEKNIDKIVSNRISFKKSKLGQGCFVPYKKAIDSNNQFIGYIYKAVQFENSEANINVCDDIKDQKKLKNLPRLMSLIRLILQVKEITKGNAGFIKNPFTHVFLSKMHKKQVQILNIDFLSETGSVQDTIRWTCGYIGEILASDASIQVDVFGCSTDLDSILARLQALAKDMTKYCSIHGIYYTSNYLFCPKCIDKAQMENVEVEKVKESDFTKKNPVNEGGESFIYSYGKGLVAKIFKGEVNYDLKSKVIARVLGKKEILEGINKKNLKYKYIIPQKLLVDTESHKVFGYIMNKVSGIPISTLRDKAQVERLKITTKDVFEILITVGKGIETLHANNIYIGDLNGRNILFDNEKNVYFLDFDGMGVDSIAPEFCTDGYIDPVSKKTQNITMKDDWYSFAVQAFYYLTFTHPFNGIYSVNEKGKQLTLDIPDKMERRISLLGNHGMKAPAIAIPWDWMNEELKISFLNIFESDNRESIVPHLVCQYEKLYKGNKPYNKSIRINPKFVATELIPFGRDVVRIINHYAAVCKNRNKYYIKLLVNNGEPKILDDNLLPECRNIHNILLAEDKKIAFAIYENKVIAVNLETNTQIYSVEISSTTDVVVNGSTLYFTGIFEGGNVIFKRDFTPEGGVEEQKIKFLAKQETKRFYARFNSKFVLVKRFVEKKVDEIYCNSEKLCDIAYSSENSGYNIIYDDATNLWLVINTEDNGIVIDASNGTYRRFKIQENINGNIENISFNNGILYVPSEGYLYIINTKDQIAIKKMECHKIMTPDSKLYDINTNGFSVVTNHMLYEVRRG